MAAGCKALALTFGRSRLTFPAMNAVSFSEARKNLKSMIDKAVADRAPLAITRRRGQEGAVLVSESEWASIEETMHLLRSPKNAERLLKAVRGLEAGMDDVVPLP